MTLSKVEVLWGLNTGRCTVDDVTPQSNASRIDPTGATGTEKRPKNPHFGGNRAVNSNLRAKGLRWPMAEAECLASNANTYSIS
ncbi:MAG: hypothetical protein ACI8W3_002227 [Myxococcota bacterium]